MARYIQESKTNEPLVVYKDTNLCTQGEIVKGIKKEVGEYKIYNDAALVKSFHDQLQQEFGALTSSIKSALECEDYEEEGVINIEGLNEAFSSISFDVEEDLMNYIIYVLYTKSESIERLNYSVLFELITGKMNHLIPGYSGDGAGGRKRPESSSPQKLRDRNKEKYHEEAPPKKTTEDDDDDNYEDDNFENIYDERNDKNSTIKVNEGADEGMPGGTEEEEGEEGEEGEDDDYIDEEEMLDVAEKCFGKIAQAI